MTVSDEDKKRYMVEFIRSYHEIEECIAPFKEHKKELRNEFKKNGWLSGQEITSAIKAYSILKSKGNMEEIYEAYSGIIGVNSEEQEGE